MKSFLYHGAVLFGLILISAFFLIAIVVGSIGFFFAAIYVLLESGWQVGRGVMARLGKKIDKELGP